jgi:hypothetical protein
MGIPSKVSIFLCIDHLVDTNVGVGNEDDYIIISLVRSRDLGFLSDTRRVNVMLTRCKMGMINFTSKAYIENYAGPGKSLIGKLISHWYEDSVWIEVGDLEVTLCTTPCLYVLVCFVCFRSAKTPNSSGTSQELCSGNGEAT